MEDLNNYGNDQMSEGSSAFISKVNNLVKEVKTFLLNVEEFEKPSYTQVQDTKFMVEQYGLAIQKNSQVLDLIRKCEFNLSLCKEVIGALSSDTVVNQRLKKQVYNVNNRIKDLLDPLYTEEKRMDRILRFYEKTYNTFI